MPGVISWATILVKGGRFVSLVWKETFVYADVQKSADPMHAMFFEIHIANPPSVLPSGCMQRIVPVRPRRLRMRHHFELV